MSSYKVGFIGAGNIASAIFSGITKSGYITTDNVYVFDTIEGKVKPFVSTGATYVPSVEEITKTCDFVFLTVKPQVYPDVLSRIKSFVNDTCLIDVAAGITTNKVKELVGFDAHVVRVMPNTPLMYGLGSSALVKCAPVTDDEFDFVRGCFDSCGVTAVVEEEMINTIIAVCGSAPAYIMRLAKSFMDYAVTNGLNSVDAQKLVMQVFAGCATMVTNSEKSIQELITMVTSPNGTTAAGLAALDSRDFDKVILDCLESTVKRAEELSK